MTLDQWQDIVSKMTPEQREAMAYYGEACHGVGSYWHTKGMAKALDSELGNRYAIDRLNECRGIA